MNKAIQELTEHTFIGFYFRIVQSSGFYDPRIPEMPIKILHMLILFFFNIL